MKFIVLLELFSNWPPWNNCNIKESGVKHNYSTSKTNNISVSSLYVSRLSFDLTKEYCQYQPTDTLILKIIGQCDAKYIMTLPIKLIAFEGLNIIHYHWYHCSPYRIRCDISDNCHYHILTYDMYEFAYAIQMATVSPYHSPCNNNAVSHRGVIRHYYYMGCDMVKPKWVVSLHF